MQEGRSLTDKEINRGLLNSLYENPLWYWGLVALLGVIVLGAMAAAAQSIAAALPPGAMA